MRHKEFRQMWHMSLKSSTFLGALPKGALDEMDIQTLKRIETIALAFGENKMYQFFLKETKSVAQKNLPHNGFGIAELMLYCYKSKYIIFAVVTVPRAQIISCSGYQENENNFCMCVFARVWIAARL